jgi:surface antigen/LysM repeat protein
VLVIVVGMFVVNVNKSSSISSDITQSQSIFQNEETKPLDSLSSADVAVHVARLTGLQESVAVVNKADTVSAQLAVASSDDSVVVKPQIIGAGLKSKKDIKKYISAEGDTVAILAERYGVSQDTIRVSNGLVGNSIPVGKELLISPVNGIVYKVKPGDTPASLASKYHANKENLIAFNDAELSGTLVADELIVIPDGIIPAVPVVARAVSYNPGFSFGTAAIYNSNGYDFGWCTWHAANRRKEIGNPVPSNLGNAISWLSVARRAGLATGDQPRAGAVLYHKNIGGLGHVAFVEKINDDGSMLVSDMNYPSWGRVTYRTVGPAEFGSYAFIY